MNEIERLKEELRRAQEEENRKRQNKIEEAKKKIPTYISWSDDYFCASIDWFDFYYWYEVTHCSKHPKIDDCEDRFDCDKRERCFTATIGDKEVMKIPASKLSVDGNIEDYMISGMLMFIKKYCNK